MNIFIEYTNYHNKNVQNEEKFRYDIKVKNYSQNWESAESSVTKI